MQMQMPLLRVQKNAHEPARRIAENPVAGGANFVAHKQKTVHRLGHFARRRAGQQPAQSGEPAGLLRRQQGHALLQRAGDEINVPHVDVQVAHEFFDALAGRAVGVAEIERHGGLQIFPQHVLRAVGVVMQFRAHAQEKIIGGFQLLAFGGADKFARLQFRQRPGAVFEKGHPQQILKIAQAAAAVFDVRLLHAGGVAVFVAPAWPGLPAAGQCIFPRSRRRIC